jgi:hypothetical protein
MTMQKKDSMLPVPGHPSNAKSHHPLGAGAFTFLVMNGTPESPHDSPVDVVQSSPCWSTLLRGLLAT